MLVVDELLNPVRLFTLFNLLRLVGQADSKVGGCTEVFYIFSLRQNSLVGFLSQCNVLLQLGLSMGIVASLAKLTTIPIFKVLAHLCLVPMWHHFWRSCDRSTSLNLGLALRLPWPPALFTRPSLQRLLYSWWFFEILHRDYTEFVFLFLNVL